MLGVWSPGSEPPPPPKEPSPDRRESQKDGGIPTVWTPSSAGASPVPEKKEFRPVQFESPILSRKKPAQQEVSYQDLCRNPFSHARKIYEWTIELSCVTEVLETAQKEGSFHRNVEIFKVVKTRCLNYG